MRMMVMLVLAVLASVPSQARERDYGSGGGYYQSSDGQEVHGPTRGVEAADGPVTATCRDGTTSYSHHHSGTCSGHGGVGQWAK